MTTCLQCISDFHPDDPRVKSGKYHLSGCDFCTIDYSLMDSGELEEVYQRLSLISKKLSGQVDGLASKKKSARITNDKYTLR